jgi:hypothetical protein
LVDKMAAAMVELMVAEMAAMTVVWTANVTGD